MEQIVYTWDQAQAEADRIKKHNQEQAQIRLDEFLSMDIGMLDATDIHYYAEVTGRTPNELRRLHPNNDTTSLMRTFENDCTDDIFDFF